MMNIRLRQFRKNLRLSQREFAGRVYMGQTTLSHLEKGMTRILDQHLYLFNKEYNLNIDWLKTGDGEMFENLTFIFLGDYARMKSLNDLEMALVKELMFLDKESRSRIMAHSLMAASS